MLIVSAPLMFPDSVGYVNTGGKILNTLVGLVSPGAPAESGSTWVEFALAASY
jgi:hypothetical protein